MAEGKPYEVVLKPCSLGRAMSKIREMAGPVGFGTQSSASV